MTRTRIGRLHRHVTAVRFRARGSCGGADRGDKARRRREAGRGSRTEGRGARGVGEVRSFDLLSLTALASVQAAGSGDAAAGACALAICRAGEYIWRDGGWCADKFSALAAGAPARAGRNHGSRASVAVSKFNRSTRTRTHARNVCLNCRARMCGGRKAHGSWHRGLAARGHAPMRSVCVCRMHVRRRLAAAWWRSGGRGLAGRGDARGNHDLPHVPCPLYSPRHCVLCMRRACFVHTLRLDGRGD